MRLSQTTAPSVGLMFAILVAGCAQPSTTAPEFSSPADDKTARICEIAAELLGVDASKVLPKTSLADLGADDLDLVEFVMELEEEFDIAIPDDAISVKNQGGKWLSDFEGLTMTRFKQIVEEQSR